MSRKGHKPKHSAPLSVAPPAISRWTTQSSSQRCAQSARRPYSQGNGRAGNLAEALVPVECSKHTPALPAMPLDALGPPYYVDTCVAHAFAETEVREAYEAEVLTALPFCTIPISN